MSQNVWSACKSWTSGIQSRFQSTSSCNDLKMPNHLRKRQHRDPAQLAKLMIDIASGEVDDPASPPETPAREFARQGGLKGGRARANKPPERRAEMAKIACRRGFSTQTTRRAIRCPFRKSYPDVLWCRPVKIGMATMTPDRWTARQRCAPVCRMRSLTDGVCIRLLIRLRRRHHPNRANRDVPQPVPANSPLVVVCAQMPSTTHRLFYSSNFLTIRDEQQTDCNHSAIMF
jgi:hypothetical protein